MTILVLLIIALLIVTHFALFAANEAIAAGRANQRLRSLLAGEKQRRLHWQNEAARKAALIAQYDVARDTVLVNRWGNLGARSWTRRRHRVLYQWQIRSIK